MNKLSTALQAIRTWILGVSGFPAEGEERLGATSSPKEEKTQHHLATPTAGFWLQLKARRRGSLGQPSMILIAASQNLQFFKNNCRQKTKQLQTDD